MSPVVRVIVGRPTAAQLAVLRLFEVNDAPQSGATVVVARDDETTQRVKVVIESAKEPA